MFNKILQNIINFLNKLKENPFIIIFAFILILLSSLITINNSFSIIGEGISKIPVVDKYNLIKNIEQLAIDSNEEYFIEKLGKPIFIEDLNDEYKEYIFYNDYSIVQAIIDESGQVVLYSVTTRYENFNPKLSLGPYTTQGEKTDVILGKTKFKDLNEFSGFKQGFDHILGAHTYSYEESYYFGNPGFYRTYIFSLNQAGYISENSIPAFDKNIESEVNSYREKAIINSYTITTDYPFDKDNFDLFFLGPDINKVRLIPGFYD